MKKALITGITGQDGSYLAELLLDKGYEVHGLKRRASSFNTGRIDPIYEDRHNENVRLFLHYADLTDSSSLIRLVQEIQPDEIYNLGAQSHVRVSWECPEFTAETDALGTLRMLEAIRMNGLAEKTKFYQASTSELYGLIQNRFNLKRRPFIRVRRMASPNCTRIGLRSIIAKVSVCSRATVFYSTMNPRGAAKTLSHAKLQWRRHGLLWGCKTSFIWAI